MPTKNYQKKSYTWVWIVGIAGILLLLFLFSRSGSRTSKVSGEYLTPANSLRDAHGLAVDVADSSKVWIASHTGLHLLKDDKDLYVVGSGRDDYMGFSIHPTDPNIFFSSGHPATGGNIGFQKSTDTGKSWQKLATGVGGPVDFHAMTVSQADPSVIYGWYRNGLQRSNDGGNTWRVIDSSLNQYQVGALATYPKDKDTVYATASIFGILISRNQGSTWQKLSESLSGDQVASFAINPTNNQEWLVYSQKLGLAKSSDGGQNWARFDAPWASSSTVMYMSYDKNKPGTIYVINRALAIYKTTDSGSTWNKVGKNPPN